jgi:ASCH domain-containing protein
MHDEVYLSEDMPGGRTMADILRAISIRQPYVEAILDGVKKIEYRSRRTNIRERVYLYASLKPQADEEFEEYGYDVDKCPRGVIVGSVEIVDCTGYEGDYEIHLSNPMRLRTFLKPKNQPQPMFWRPQF